MIKRLLLFLITMAMASSSMALTYSSKKLEAGRLEIFTFTTGEAVADSDGITNGCGAVSIGFYAATGGTAAVYAVQDANTATSSGVLIANLTASQTGAVVVPAYPVLKIRPTAAPSAGIAKVFMHCSGTAGGGGGGASDYFTTIASSFFSDQTQRSALNAAMWEHHHWSTLDVKSDVFTPIGIQAWDGMYGTTGACTDLTFGTRPGQLNYINDLAFSDTCEAGPGGSNQKGMICRCADEGTGYGGAIPDGVLAHLWAIGYSGPSATPDNAYLYPTDIFGAGYPSPMLRLDMLEANNCVSTRELSHDIIFQRGDQATIYSRITPWNWNAQLALAPAALADSIAFIGFVREDPTKPGVATYIDPTVAGPSALIEADFVDGFGFMWVDSKWYVVTIQNSVLASTMVYDPVASLGSVAEYINGGMGGTISMLLQTDFDGQFGARKTGAYALSRESTASTDFHNQFTSMPTLHATGSPRSGYSVGGGVGFHYQRLFVGCLENGSASVIGRFFLSQLDVIK